MVSSSIGPVFMSSHEKRRKRLYFRRFRNKRYANPLVGIRRKETSRALFADALLYSAVYVRRTDDFIFRPGKIFFCEYFSRTISQIFIEKKYRSNITNVSFIIHNVDESDQGISCLTTRSTYSKLAGS